MRRRDFIVIGGAAALCPSHAALAQTAAARPRVGALYSQAEGDNEGRARAEAFRLGLQELGWTNGRNLMLDHQWSGGNPERLRALAESLVAEKPAAILASATTALVALQRATRTVPIVFAQVTDPVGAGFVASLSRPGGNITGLTQHEFAIGAKWIEILKQVAPRTTHAAVLYDPSNPTAVGYLDVLRPAARAGGLGLSAFPIRTRNEIEAAVNASSTQGDAGLIVLPGAFGSANRDLIIALALRHRLPSMFAFRYHVIDGGLISYGVDNIDLYRRAAWYVDRILRGSAPGDLPVQHASKFQIVINLKTAKALGLSVPLDLLTGADEVIE